MEGCNRLMPTNWRGPCAVGRAGPGQWSIRPDWFVEPRIYGLVLAMENVRVQRNKAGGRVEDSARLICSILEDFG